VKTPSEAYEPIAAPDRNFKSTTCGLALFPLPSITTYEAERCDSSMVGSSFTNVIISVILWLSHFSPPLQSQAAGCKGLPRLPPAT